MGHVQSKRRKERKRRKISQLSEIMKNMTSATSDSENIHQVAGHRIYRDSSNMDQLSNSSGYFSSSEPSPHSGGTDTYWAPGEDMDSGNGVTGSLVPEKSNAGSWAMSPLEELCTYKGLPIDGHPALTKLQNEQNARLEIMELRMSKIRTNAQQAYDRKKFAHMFRAKKEDSKTDKLLEEAKALLQENIESRRALETSARANSGEYSGEIIPVQIVEDNHDEEEDSGFLHLATFGSLKFSEPVLLLILPFLLPLFIIVAIIRGMSEIFGWKQISFKPKSRRNS